MTGPRLARNDLSGKIIRNTLFNTLGKFCSVLTGLFLTPYIVARLGLERFGIWAIVGVLTGYFGLLDFGVSSSFVRYIAGFYTKREYGNITKLVETGFTLYSIFALTGTALILVFAGPLVGLLHIPGYLHGETTVVMIGGIVLFGASNMIGPFIAVQGGLQRMDISNKISIAMALVNAAGTVYVLERGYGLIGLLANSALIFIIASAINAAVAFRILPELRFRAFSFDRGMFAELFHFGYKMQIAKISGLVTAQTDKVLIAALLSIGLVTFYQLGSSIVAFTMSIAMVLTAALMPAFSEIEAGGDRPRLVEAYLRSIKYFAFLIVPIFTLLIVMAPEIIFVWMGSGFASSAAVMRILAFAFMINAIAQVPVSVSVSINKPEYMAVGSVITIVSNVILSILLIKVFGFLGVAWGTLLAVNAGTIFFLFQLHAGLKVPLKRIVGPVLPSLIGSIVAAAALSLAAMAAARYGLAAYGGRVETLGAICVKGAIFMAVYIFSIYRLRPFDPAEAAVFREKVPIVGPLIGRIFFRA